VINPTNQPIPVFGGTSDGRQQEWIMPPHSTSLSPANPFDHRDVDGVIVNGETIKIWGILGSVIAIPSDWTPSTYQGFTGWILRGFGIDPVIPDFKKEFGVPLTPAETKCP
jgi:hypothetical protein